MAALSLPPSRFKAWLGRHEANLRLTVRITVAGVLAFGIAQALNLPQSYWASFTAVLVMQASVGASVKAAIDWLVGTLGGAAYGAAVAMSMPTTTPPPSPEPWPSLWRLPRYWRPCGPRSGLPRSRP